MLFDSKFEIAFIRVSPNLSATELLAMHPTLTAQRQTFAAAPGNPRQRVQQVWLTFSPHLVAHFLSLSSHPEVALHFLYWSVHFCSMHAVSSGD